MKLEPTSRTKRAGSRRIELGWIGVKVEIRSRKYQLLLKLASKNFVPVQEGNEMNEKYGSQIET